MERDARLILVKDFMNTAVYALHEGDDIVEALDRLRRTSWSGAPVIDDQKHVVGLLTERDCMRILANSLFHAEPVGTVSAQMSRDVETVSPEDDLFTVVARLERSHHKRLPVVEDGKLVGLVTIDDVDRALRQLQRLREQVHAAHPLGASSAYPDTVRDEDLEKA